MIKSYEIGYFDASQKLVLVYSTNYCRMDSYIQDLEFDLMKKEFTGNVIVDLLMSNGNSSNRYVKIPFNGEKFTVRSTSVLNDVPNKIKKLSFDFYSSHPEILDNGILNKAQKFLIRKGYDQLR